MKVLFSEGFGSFDLKPIARATASAGLGSVELYTGAAISGPAAAALAAIERRLPRRLGRPLARLRQRAPAPTPGLDSQPTWAGEIEYQLANRLNGSRRLGRWSDWAMDRGVDAYCRSVAARIARAPAPAVSIIRSGYGAHVIEAARRAGSQVVVYHSIAHPFFLDRLSDEGAQSPRMRRRILDDLAAADILSCNSDFVRDTLIEAGLDPARIHVHYLGLPHDFSPQEGEKPENAERTFAFIGSMDERKGVRLLLEALGRLRDPAWRLLLVGRPHAHSAAALAQWAADSRVVHHPSLSRDEVRALLHRAGVFVFPTRAEGSARVAWEALASGCDMITTRECGSIVVDGVNGQLVPSGDVAALAAAMEAALADPEGVRRRGRENAKTISEHWRGEARLAGYLPSLMAFMGRAANGGSDATP